MTINILELIGTFFLGIEAIKLKNFKKFRLNLKNINSILNPKIKWVEENDEEYLKIKNNYNFEIFLSGLLISSGIIYFGLLYLFKIDILGFIPIEKSNWYYYPKIALGLMITLIFWTVAIYLFELIIYLLIQLEKFTKTGVIGIIGILFFMTTFLLKTFAI